MTQSDSMPDRFVTGVPGLDVILRGGLFKGGMYIAIGRPGAGKTILSSQICFEHLARGGRAVYVTLLAESHARLLAQLGSMSFFDPTAVGDRIRYVSGFTAISSEGLAGLLALLQRSVRDQRATLLVLDGMVTAEHMAPSSIDFKKFVHELQTWTAMLGCTVLLLTSARSEQTLPPEHTMVDGIFELGAVPVRQTSERQLTVSKLRGSGYLEGRHTYRISNDGVTFYPRIESLRSEAHGPLSPQLLKSGVPGLDGVLGGGLSAGSCSLLLGPSGGGKTVLALQFLAEAIRAGERTLFVGHFENPSALELKAKRFSIDLGGDRTRIVWRIGAELSLDVVIHELLAEVKRHRPSRLVIDGFAALGQSTSVDRVAGAFAVLSELLAAAGVTTVITDETKELFVQNVEIPTRGVSAIFHNILFLREVDLEGELLRLISVLKTRDASHDRWLHHFEITDRGVAVGKRFGRSGGMIGRTETVGGPTVSTPPSPPEGE